VTPITRRALLGQAAVASSWLWVRPAAAQAPPPAPALPPSIAALTSLRGEARPITTAERDARVERARALMRDARLDAILIPGGTTLDYFSGARWGNSERLLAMVIPRDGAPFVVIPAFEEERVREQLRNGPLISADIRVWQESESPFALVAAALRDRGIAAGRLGIEETTKFVFSDSLASAAPALKITSATPVVAGCRMRKSPAELALLRLACRATLQCYGAVYKALRPGMTENDVRTLIAAAYGRLGFPGGASVQVGEYTALPHGSTMPQTIRDGTIIMLDDGCRVEGYTSDLTRTFVLGAPTAKMKHVFTIVSEAQHAALAAAKPGVPLASIDAAARKVVSDAGYGPGYKYFTHRLGHGIGMDMHEWPYLVPNNMFGWEQALVAQPGMTFSDEPGIYIPGEFGVRLEDVMEITESGAGLMTAPSRSLEAPFAG